MAMVIARRSVAVFLGVWSIGSLFFRCATVQPELYISNLPVLPSGPVSSCVSSFPPSFETWLFHGVLLLVAVVLWVAPWSRFTRELPPLLMPMRWKRRLVHVGGWLLVGLGVGVIAASLLGLFVDIMIWETVTWRERQARAYPFSLVRGVGIAFGLSALVWGSLELRLDQIRLIRQLIQTAVVFAVLGILIAPGYPGIGVFQGTAFVIVLAVAVVVIVFRYVLAGWLAQPLRSRYALHVPMASSVILGAWTLVLTSVSPVGCQGGVRCADELRSATLLAISAVAAGFYFVYARWKATRPLELDHGTVSQAS